MGNKLDQLQNKLLLFDTPQPLKNMDGLQNFNRTYTIKIQKFAEGYPIVNYQIFGYNVGQYFGTDPPLLINPPVITIAQSSVDQVNRDMASNPFTTMFCRYKTDNIANLYYPIIYQTKDSTGKLVETEISPITYLETEDRFSSNGLIYIPDFKDLVFDGQTMLYGYIEPYSTITMVLTLQNKVQIGAAANFQNILTKNNTPAPGQVRKVDFTNTSQKPESAQKIQIINPLTKNC